MFFTLICYLTNPFVVLFADEYGNLPRIFKLWQTYDSTLDVEWLISEKIVPKIFRYDFNRYYKYTTDDKTTVLIPAHVEIIEKITSFKIKVQRYFCRLCWLYRNTAYGFSYSLLGVNYDKYNIFKFDMTGTDWNELFYRYDYSSRFLFSIKGTKNYSLFGWKRKLDVYVGWKVGDGNNTHNKQKAMFAFRVSPLRNP